MAGSQPCIVVVCRARTRHLRLTVTLQVSMLCTKTLPAVPNPMRQLPKRIVVAVAGESGHDSVAPPAYGLRDGGAVFNLALHFVDRHPQRAWRTGGVFMLRSGLGR